MKWDVEPNQTFWIFLLIIGCFNWMLNQHFTLGKWFFHHFHLLKTGWTGVLVCVVERFDIGFGVIERIVFISRNILQPKGISMANPSKITSMNLHPPKKCGPYWVILLMATRSPARKPSWAIGSLSHYLRRVLAPSQVVVWDFFHQQYNSPFVSLASQIAYCLIPPGFLAHQVSWKTPWGQTSPKTIMTMENQPFEDVYISY